MEEDIWLEDRLWPWLADDCMADDCAEPIEEPWYFCDACGSGCDDDESPCPDCGSTPEP